jgi:hypothetical protein
MDWFSFGSGLPPSPCKARLNFRQCPADRGNILSTGYVLRAGPLRAAFVGADELRG